MIIITREELVMCQVSNQHYKRQRANKAKRISLSKPSAYQVQVVRALLSDFGIYDDIPDFDTNKELNEWKSRLIREHLS